MRKILCIFLTLAAVLLNAANVFPVKDKKPAAQIVIPADAIEVEKFAARELVEHIRLISGVTLPVVTRAGGKLLPIYLGRAAEFDGAAQGVNNCLISIKKERIDIAGGDAPGNALDPRVAAGTLFGVYEFLERFAGIRWLWPGEIGTLASFKGDFSVPETLISYRHKMKFQCWRLGSNHANWYDPANGKMFFRESSLYLRRHRATAVDSMAYGHAFTRLYEKIGSRNPEFFNLLPNGKRQPDPVSSNGNPRLISMCVSNPDFARFVVQTWAAGDRRRMLNANENDTAGKCVCPQCMSDDASNDPERLKRAAEKYSRGERFWYEELGTLSERYAKFYLRLQELADQIDPDHRIIGCIYANYYTAPVKNKLNSRIVMRFCPPVMYPWTAKKKAMFKELWQGWYDSGASLLMRPNFTLDGHNFPLIYYKDFDECFQFASSRRMVGADFDSLRGVFGANGLTHYVIACRLGGDERKLSELEDDYFAAFGKAEPLMRRFAALMENATGNSPAVKSREIEGGRWADFFLNADMIFTPEIMKEGFRLLDEMAAVVKDDKLSSARVKFVRIGLTDAQLVLNVQQGFRLYQQSGSVGELRKAMQELRKFRMENEKYLYADIGSMRTLEARHWPGHIIDLPDGSVKLENWQIFFDHSKSGDKNGAQNGLYGTWEKASVETPWEKSDAGKKWKAQHGVDFKGVAWYKTTFNLDGVDKNIRCELNFGAIDGNAEIFCNGKLILRREYPCKGDADSWKKPFSADISHAVRNGENMVVVRVEKYIGVSGIWRAVYITAGNDFAGENLDVKLFRNNIQSGKFTFQTGCYPLIISCTGATAPKGKAGIWGRSICRPVMVPGKLHGLRVKYRTDEKFSGLPAVWVRSAGSRELNAGNVNMNLPLSPGKSNVVTIYFTPERADGSIHFTIRRGIGTLIVEEAELARMPEVKQ